MYVYKTASYAVYCIIYYTKLVHFTILYSTRICYTIQVSYVKVCNKLHIIVNIIRNRELIFYHAVLRILVC